ncbi:O-antigen ligase family protein [Stella sp.]|uniref:O-antigen ligase family protein n=1 Tax=Stella sp. TaxID=2912054 RepID=UPI0035B1804C
MTPARGRLPALALAATLVLTAVLALHAHRAAAPILAAAGIAVPALAWFAGQRPRPSLPFAALFAGLLAWAALGLAWSIDPAAGIDQWPRVAYLLATGLLLVAVAAGLAPEDARMAGRALVLGFALAAVLLVVEAATGGAVKALVGNKSDPVMALKAGSTILVLLLWPAVAVLADDGRRGAAAVLALAVAVPLGLLDGRAAFLALLAGAAVFAAAWAAPRSSAALVAVGAAIGILAAPFLVLHVAYPLLGGFADGDTMLPFSGRHRLEIWRFAAERILERPLTGWGFNVSRVFPGGERILDAGSGAMQMPLHPHNAALHWWLELGLPGALAGAAAVALLAGAARRLPTPAARAAGLAQVASGLVVAMLSYGAWQNWWLAALGLAAAATAAVGRIGPPQNSSPPPDRGRPLAR